jgi:hypothetical protein
MPATTACSSHEPAGHPGKPGFHTPHLSRQGRYQGVRDNLRVKEVRLDCDPTRRWIICHNRVKADRNQARRAQQLAAIEAERERIAAERAADINKAKARAAKNGKQRAPKPSDAPHRKAE